MGHAGCVALDHNGSILRPHSERLNAMERPVATRDTTRSCVTLFQQGQELGSRRVPRQLCEPIESTKISPDAKLKALQSFGKRLNESYHRASMHKAGQGSCKQGPRVGGTGEPCTRTGKTRHAYICDASNQQSSVLFTRRSGAGEDECKQAGEG